MKSLPFLLLTLVACAGTQESVTQPQAAGAGSAAQAKTPTSGDVAFEVPAAEVQGIVFEPESLGRPGMPLVDPKGAKKPTLDKQRAAVASAKDPVLKQAQAAVLATMLYKESKADKAKEKDLLKEARQVLRDVAQQVGDKAVDEITLRMLGSYELLLEDYAAAEKAWQALIAKDPKSKENPNNRAWLAYAQLKQFKNAEALASVASEPLDDKQRELAYVTAWAKLRTGDGAGAWQAINVAAKGWPQDATRESLEHEVLWFAARGNIPHDQAIGQVTSVLAKGKPQQYQLLATLGLGGYGLAGRWSDSVATLDKALEVAGDAAAPLDRPAIRYRQAEFTVPLDTPDVAVKYAKQAIEAITACGAKCAPKDTAVTITNIYNMGRLFHVLFATANDHRYYEPAHEIYALTIPLITEPATKAQAQDDLTKLEKTLKTIKVGTGTHDKGAVSALLGRHTQEVQACYEAGLGGNPKLGGPLVVNLESDATGAIKGVSTEPKAGMADLPAVARCVEGRAKQWKLPKRGMPGSTRIKLSYTLAVRK